MDPRRERRKALAAIRKARSFFLTGHVRPDGDCLGSALALRVALRRMGKRAEVYSLDPVPSPLRGLPGAASVKVGRRPKGRFDAAIFLECSSPERAGGLLDLGRQAGTVINIDSHITTGTYGHINLIEPFISSTAEQVFNLLKELGARIDEPIATCLYAGVATDTGRFHYSNTTPSALRMTADFLEAGVDAPRLNDRLFSTRSLASLKLLARSLDGLRLLEGGRVAVLRVTAADFRATGALGEDTEELVNYGMMPPGVEASLILKEVRDGIRVSLRARGKVDVSRVAAAFSGGGHRNAAGCTLEGPLAAAEGRLLSELRKGLRKTR